MLIDATVAERRLSCVTPRYPRDALLSVTVGRGAEPARLGR
jgi:hypothetical protein